MCLSLPFHMHVPACSVTQSCLTLCDPMDYSPPDSFVCGIFQVRILEWVAISSSRRSSPPRDQTCTSCIGQADFLPLNHLGSPFNVYTSGQYLISLHCVSRKPQSVTDTIRFILRHVVGYQGMGFEASRVTGN